MSYLVVIPHKLGLSKILITTAETVLPNPFESWALNDGKKILFVTNTLHGLVKTFYVAGKYESGAMYNCSYQEMVAIVRSKLGPSDRERYENAKSAPAQVQSPISEYISRERTILTLHLVIQVCTTVLFALWKAISIVLFLPVAGLIALIIGRPK